MNRAFHPQLQDRQSDSGFSFACKASVTTPHVDVHPGIPRGSWVRAQPARTSRATIARAGDFSRLGLTDRFCMERDEPDIRLDIVERLVLAMVRLDRKSIARLHGVTIRHQEREA